MTTSEAKKGKGEGSGLKMTERMLKSRTVLLSSDVSPSSARRVIEQLLVLEADDPDKPITLVVNSPGGDVHSGFAIYDVIRFIRPEVRIVCSGLAASIATVVLLAADKKNRLALPNCRLLLHQPLFHGEVFGPASDLEITANEIIKTKEHINVLIARETGQSLEKVIKDTERDFWLSAEEARDYGLVSRVVESRDNF
ncbi:MAG: ATP-dependent Clp protease proteolytic subunit [Deltaproteobacteria bacterium]|nr:ATP-dependent Clp protease proteolytic subunit [Deltaproteobacteria bacterium]